MPEARLEIHKTIVERGTFKATVRTAMLRWAALVEQYNIPENATIQVEIPGGGDWSSCRVDADEIDVVVTWETHTDG